MNKINHVEKYLSEWADKITKQGWLDYLHNTYGQFKLASANRKEKEAIWTKWRDYEECRNDQTFIRQSNNRTILPCELVLDLEQPEQISSAVKYLEEKQIYNFSVFRTGSRGYHIHIIHPLFLHDLNAYDKKLKIKILQKTGGELLKASTNVMIALEFTPHWKTGIPKEYIPRE